MKIFKRKEDAEFVAERNSQFEEEGELRAQKVRVSDEKLARRIGISIHSDLSIASRYPKMGETGWVVIKKGEKIKDNYKKVLEILENDRN